jgi:hypothetical protein
VFLPEVLRDDDRSMVFFRKDDIFGKPKANCQFVLVAPPAYESPAAAVMSDLFAKLVKVLSRAACPVLAHCHAVRRRCVVFVSAPACRPLSIDASLFAVRLLCAIL